MSFGPLPGASGSRIPKDAMRHYYGSQETPARSQTPPAHKRAAPAAAAPEFIVRVPADIADAVYAVATRGVRSIVCPDYTLLGQLRTALRLAGQSGRISREVIKRVSLRVMADLPAAELPPVPEPAEPPPPPEELPAAELPAPPPPEETVVLPPEPDLSPTGDGTMLDGTPFVGVHAEEPPPAPEHLTPVPDEQPPGDPFQLDGDPA